MKRYHTSLLVVLLLAVLAIGGNAYAQVTNSTGSSNGTGMVTPPTLYNQSGASVNGYNSATNSLTPGWYYTKTGSPRYYYANGVYYDPANQTYGGSILYPGATGPQSGSTGAADATISGSSAAALGSNPPATASTTSSSNSNSTGISGTVVNTSPTTAGVMNPDGTFTPGVPNTGVGGAALSGWLALIASALIAVVGTRYLTRNNVS